MADGKDKRWEDLEPWVVVGFSVLIVVAYFAGPSAWGWYQDREDRQNQQASWDALPADQQLTNCKYLETGESGDVLEILLEPFDPSLVAENCSDDDIDQLAVELLSDIWTAASGDDRVAWCNRFRRDSRELFEAAEGPLGGLLQRVGFGRFRDYFDSEC